MNFQHWSSSSHVLVSVKNWNEITQENVWNSIQNQNVSYIDASKKLFRCQFLRGPQLPSAWDTLLVWKCRALLKQVYFSSTERFPSHCCINLSSHIFSSFTLSGDKIKQELGFDYSCSVCTMRVPGSSVLIFLSNRELICIAWLTLFFPLSY